MAEVAGGLSLGDRVGGATRARCRATGADADGQVEAQRSKPKGIQEKVQVEV